MTKYLIPSLWLACALLGGCAALQKGVDNTNDWLAKPATTQPGAPTNEQAVQAGGAVVSTVAPQPVGVAIGVGLTALLTLAHLLDSRNRTKQVIQAVGESKAAGEPPAK